MKKYTVLLAITIVLTIGSITPSQAGLLGGGLCGVMLGVKEGFICGALTALDP